MHVALKHAIRMCAMSSALPFVTLHIMATQVTISSKPACWGMAFHHWILYPRVLLHFVALFVAVFARRTRDYQHHHLQYYRSTFHLWRHSASLSRDRHVPCRWRRICTGALAWRALPFCTISFLRVVPDFFVFLRRRRPQRCTLSLLLYPFGFSISP